jgi:hypothetical protein
MQDSKSLMYNKNNTGPGTEPCGTPYLMGTLPDKQLMILLVSLHLYVISTLCSPFLDMIETILVLSLVFPFQTFFLAKFHDPLSQTPLTNP